jgi:non-heme chloroperoxidase
MLQTDANPEGLPVSAFDALREGVLGDRSQFYEDLSAAFYGANRPGSTVSQGKRDEFWLQCMTVGIKPALDCITAFSETDLTGDLATIDVPTLFVHGDDDQIVPIGASARKAVDLVGGRRWSSTPARRTACTVRTSSASTPTCSPSWPGPRRSPGERPGPRPSSR